MVRVANFTGLPVGAVMLVGRPVILSNPRRSNCVPPCGATGGGAAAEASCVGATAVLAAGGAAGALGPVTEGGGWGMTGLAAGAAGAGAISTLAAGVWPWATAAAAMPSGRSARTERFRDRFT